MIFFFMIFAVKEIKGPKSEVERELIIILPFCHLRTRQSASPECLMPNAPIAIFQPPFDDIFS